MKEEEKVERVRILRGTRACGGKQMERGKVYDLPWSEAYKLVRMGKAVNVKKADDKPKGDHKPGAK